MGIEWQLFERPMRSALAVLTLLSLALGSGRAAAAPGKLPCGDACAALAADCTAGAAPADLLAGAARALGCGGSGAVGLGPACVEGMQFLLAALEEPAGIAAMEQCTYWSTACAVACGAAASATAGVAAVSG